MATDCSEGQVTIIWMAEHLKDTCVDRDGDDTLVSC